MKSVKFSYRSKPGEKPEAESSPQEKKRRGRGFFRIEIPLYFTIVDVYIDPFGKDTLKQLSRKYNIQFEDDEIDGNAAVTYDLQQSPYNLSVIPMIFDDLPSMMKRDPSGAIALVAHELLHATNIIIASRGLGKNNEKSQDEVACYLMQDLMHKFLDAYKRLMNNKKHKKQGNKKDEEE